MQNESALSAAGGHCAAGAEPRRRATIFRRVCDHWRRVGARRRRGADAVSSCWSSTSTVVVPTGLLMRLSRDPAASARARAGELDAGRARTSAASTRRAGSSSRAEAPPSFRCSGSLPPGPPVGLRQHRRPAERRQVDAAEPHPRPQDRRRHAEAADHAPPPARHQDARRRRRSCSSTRPGIHAARDLLNERMVERALQSLQRGGRGAVGRRRRATD